MGEADPAAFDRAILSLALTFTPIVRIADRSLFGYDISIHSAEPDLSSADALWSEAERLGRTADLGTSVRQSVAKSKVTNSILIPNNVNELFDESDLRLGSSGDPLLAVASSVVLKIGAHAPLRDMAQTTARLPTLREAGYRFAFERLRRRLRTLGRARGAPA
jgi:EAL domain-containing protein (putative c-di-GMP-specific phosphodiesterase class I)